MCILLWKARKISSSFWPGVLWSVPADTVLVRNPRDNVISLLLHVRYPWRTEFAILCLSVRFAVNIRRLIASRLKYNWPFHLCVCFVHWTRCHWRHYRCLPKSKTAKRGEKTKRGTCCVHENILISFVFLRRRRRNAKPVAVPTVHCIYSVYYYYLYVTWSRPVDEPGRSPACNSLC